MTTDTRTPEQRHSFAAWSGSYLLHQTVCLIQLRDCLRRSGVTSFEGYWDPHSTDYGTFEALAVTGTDGTDCCDTSIDHFAHAVESGLYLRTRHVDGPTLLKHEVITTDKVLPQDRQAVRVQVADMLNVTTDDLDEWDTAAYSFVDHHLLWPTD